MKNPLQIPGFQLIDVETENASSLFYKAYAVDTGKHVLIKVMKTNASSVEERASAIHEFHMSRQLTGDSTLRPLQTVHYLNKDYFVYEYFSSITLEELLQQPVSIYDGLKIAKNIATALFTLHQQQLIHQSINPENLLLSRRSHAVKITGLNHSTVLKQEHYEAVTRLDRATSRHWPYMSPEQTGRMNRSVDYRTDFYSLGITFYQLFTGTVPFQHQEPMQLVHAHLAKTPKQPSALRKDLPSQISAIIMKLLAKSPEARYKSAWGVREDLSACLSQYYVVGRIEEFPLGLHDDLSVFTTAHKIYGREHEAKQMEDVFSHVSSGSPGIVFIPGQAGIGKTALVHEIHKPLIKEKGYFISGKFDPMQRQVPFSSIISAFQSLIRQITAETPQQIQTWKEKLEKELSIHAAVLASILPELKWLLGERQTIKEQEHIDIQKNFPLVMKKFIEIFAAKEHPLVMFLDDLQWADIASLELLEYLLTRVNIPYFMVIGAFRDNEVNEPHPLQKTIRTLKKEAVHYVEIPLTTLPRQTIYEWLMESFMDEGPHIKELSIFMHRITQGNPFYTKQLLQSYYEDGYIMLQPEKRKWTIAYEAITENPVKGGIISFLVNRIHLLPEATQHILKLAACIGNFFDLETLAMISKKTKKEAASDLWMALEAGLILPNDQWYKWGYLKEEKSPAYTFLHDRVQQAVYSTMTREEQEKAHVTIGNFLVHCSKGIEDHLFTVVHHLNRSIRHLTGEEMIQLANWNVQAGEKAKASAAFAEALKYFQTAGSLTGPLWSEEYELTFRMLKGLGECQYVMSQFAEAESTFDQILRHSRSPADKLAIYNMKMRLYTHMHRVEEAVQAGIEGLKLFDIDLSRKITKWDIIREFLLVKQTLSKNAKEKILTLPKLTDKDRINVLDTMITMNSSSYHIDQHLATLLMLKALRYTLKYGLTDISALVVNNYALILSAGFSDFKGSHEFGQLALELSERFNHLGIKGRVQFVYGSFVQHWLGPISDNLLYLERSQRYCLDAGNIHLAGANSSFIVITLLIKGTSLDEALAGVQNQIQFIDQIQYKVSRAFLYEIRDWIEFLKGRQTKPLWELETIVDDDSAKIIHYTIRLQMAYLFDKREYARQLLALLVPMINKRLTLVIVPEYYFYNALWQARFYEEAEGVSEKKRIYRTLQKHARKLKKWADLSPSNYRHKYLLLKAEMQRLTSKRSHHETIALYTDSIHYAEQNGFTQDAAIAYECAGNYFAGAGLSVLADPFLKNASEAFKKWGAAAKAQQMAEACEELSEENSAASLPQHSSFDAHAALEVTQSISKEIVLEKLSAKLMQIAMEYGGADRGMLLYRQEDEFILSEYKSLDESQGNWNKQQPITGTGILSDKIVQFAYVSKEPVVLDHAAALGMFTDDPYVLRQKTKSLLCLPILNKGKVTGMLYLENNKATHAFTQEKIQFLAFISTQAAISIENADLYEQMEATVEKRTAELHEANIDLEKLNQQLAQAEESRRHFIENISHDLRAPLSSIRGYMEAISDGMVLTEAEKTRYLQKGLERVDELHSLIHNLFTLSRLESGQMPFNMDFVSLQQFAERLYRKFEYEIKQQGLSFTVVNQFQSEEEADPLIEMDVEKMEQVFTNLLTNARNHTKSGEIRLLFEKVNEGNEVMIHIQDTGSGIPSSDLPYIFDRNYTKTSSRLNKKGYGLGLSICQEIVTFHKGQIWVESTKDKGTTFFIALPLFQYAAEYS
ncbi:ATP-binding sensor histidine kinase [Bacillus badius]|uniref:ATP-binding sensor histidine kinase n=1 Tax=Bacillus badius TaxID=1455 RepID=UPI000597DDDC|nr:ATP-binding sensor histidine kinase [Bacillus badius]KIL73775.1 Serine/threonine protein kinase PrkC [Bacillus badius]